MTHSADLVGESVCQSDLNRHPRSDFKRFFGHVSGYAARSAIRRPFGWVRAANSSVATSTYGPRGLNQGRHLDFLRRRADRLGLPGAIDSTRPAAPPATPKWRWRSASCRSRSNHRGIAAPLRDLIEFPRHPLAGERVVDDRCDVLPAEVTDDTQDAEAAARRRSPDSSAGSRSCGMAIGALVPYVERFRWQGGHF